MIPYSTQSIGDDDIAAVVNVLKSSHLTQGDEVEAFEAEIAAYIGTRHAVVFNAATSALFAAYSAAGIGAEDEVLTTPISFVATSNMAVAAGATPVFCDVKLDGNIDERFVERAITPRTKAIVPVDFAGKSVEIETLREIADRNGVMLIEDASHAFGSRFRDRKVGAYADMAIFSFHAIKPLTTGEGGAVVTNDDALAERLRLFRSHGMVKKRFWNSDMVSLGYNLRMTDIAAALGRSQLKKVDAFIARRNEIAAYYDERFAGEKLFSVTKMPEHLYSSRHLYPVLLAPELQCPKEEIFAALHERGIGVQVHYKPIYKNSFYEKRFGDQRFPVAEDFYRSELSIPCHQRMTLEDAGRVADILLDTVGRYRYRSCSF